MDLGGMQCRWHLLLLIIQLHSVVCSTFVVAVDCTASNKTENVQLVTTKHTPNKFHNFNPGISSFFPCLGEQAGPTRLGEGNEAVPYLPVILLTPRTACQQYQWVRVCTASQKKQSHEAAYPEPRALHHLHKRPREALTFSFTATSHLQEESGITALLWMQTWPVHGNQQIKLRKLFTVWYEVFWRKC